MFSQICMYTLNSLWTIFDGYMDCGSHVLSYDDNKGHGTQLDRYLPFPLSRVNLSFRMPSVKLVGDTVPDQKSRSLSNVPRENPFSHLFRYS